MKGLGESCDNTLFDKNKQLVYCVDHPYLQRIRSNSHGSLIIIAFWHKRRWYVTRTKTLLSVHRKICIILLPSFFCLALQMIRNMSKTMSGTYWLMLTCLSCSMLVVTSLFEWKTVRYYYNVFDFAGLGFPLSGIVYI